MKRVIHLLLAFVALFACTARLSARQLVVGLVDDCGFTADDPLDNVYGRALMHGGHTPVFIPSTLDSLALRQLLQTVDVVFLTGGEDINPSRFGAEASPALGSVNERRDTFEYRVLAQAVQLRKPIFGTCRGEQVINVFFGGTLYQDIPTEVPTAGRHRNVNHPVRIAKRSRLHRVLGVESIVTNSSHHQAVKDVAPGFYVAARSEDGIVEAIESKRYPVAAVQFHPEWMWPDDPRFTRIYTHLRRLCR